MSYGCNRIGYAAVTGYGNAQSNKSFGHYFAEAQKHANGWNTASYGNANSSFSKPNHYGVTGPVVSQPGNYNSVGPVPPAYGVVGPVVYQQAPYGMVGPIVSQPGWPR